MPVVICYLIVLHLGFEIWEDECAKPACEQTEGCTLDEENKVACHKQNFVSTSQSIPKILDGI